MQYKGAFAGLLYLVITGVMVVTVSGCASTPKANFVQDAQAKLFKTHPQKSIIYIYRRDTQSSSVEMELMIDGQHVATSVGGTYIKLEVNPGRHRLVAYADNSNKLMLATLKNKNYFISQDVREHNVQTQTRLSLVNEATGQSGVKQCEMILLNPQAANLSLR